MRDVFLFDLRRFAALCFLVRRGMRMGEMVGMCLGWHGMMRRV